MPISVYILALVDYDFYENLVVSKSEDEAKAYIRNHYPEAKWNEIENRYEIEDPEAIDIQWFEIEEVRFIG